MFLEKFLIPELPSSKNNLQKAISAPVGGPGRPLTYKIEFDLPGQAYWPYQLSEP
jgi:hypothetical protein